jgi:YNFM family putative membrane transporter
MKEIAAAWSRLTGQPENQLFRPGGCRPTSDTRAPAVGADQASAAYAGRLVDRFGRPPMLWIMAAITLAGLLLMAAGSVATVIIGLLVTTGGFFAAHSVASGWVSAGSARLGVQGSAVYVCCYYLGSGVGGTLGGLAFSAGGWSAVTYYTGAFLLAVLTIAILLRKLRPAAPDGGN